MLLGATAEERELDIFPYPSYPALSMGRPQCPVTLHSRLLLETPLITGSLRGEAAKGEGYLRQLGEPRGALGLVGNLKC